MKQPRSITLALLLLVIHILSQTQDANAFASVCADCIVPPTQMDKLRKEIVWLGQAVREGDYAGKQTVRIAIIKNGRDVGYCSAPVLTKDSVLPSAHCFESKPKEVRVEFYSATGKLIKSEVTKFIKVYDHFDYETGKGDLAVVHVPGGIPDSFSKPKLSMMTPSTGDKVVFAGFGFDEKGQLGTLKQADGEVVGTDENLEFVEVKGAKGAAACKGDSGGPAYVIRNGEPELFGNLSHSTDCKTGESTSYFTNFMKYQVWIQSSLNDLRIKAKNDRPNTKEVASNNAT